MVTYDVGSGLPAVLAPVTLRLRLPTGASAEAPTRVCDVEDVDGLHRIVVARPDLSGRAEAGTLPHEGEALALLWSRPTGRMRLQVAAAVGSRPYGPVWVLTPLGAPTQEQRRQYFRVPLTLPALLTPVGDESADDAGVRATLVELSEGGAVISCAGGLPEVGTFVELSFTLDGTSVTAEAEVLRQETPANGRPIAALRFLDPAAYGDDIRRYAFAAQRTRARPRLG
jgi:hypothetical protein